MNPSSRHPNRETHVHVRASQNHMATTFDFVISAAAAEAPRAGRLLDRAHELMDVLERQLSEFIADSAVARLNRARAGERVAAPDCLIELLERSERIRAQTDNAFHCTAKSPAHVPLPAVAWDRARNEVWKLHDEAHVGFGAIGKGFALDQARKLLVSQGFNDFLLSAGGSSICLSGFAGPREPWRWGWSWQKDAEGDHLGIPLSHPSGTSLSIGVSGTHEKGDHIRGERFASDRTGPDAGSPRSALIAMPSAADADALSTALFTALDRAGWDKGLELVGKGFVQPAVACIDPAGVPRWNGTFQKLFGSVMGVLLLAAAHLVTSPLAARAADSGAAQQADDAVDLGSMGLDKFTPYITERNPLWALLPVCFGLFVLLHLTNPRKKNRRPVK